MMAEKLESLEAADRFSKLGGHQHAAAQWLAQGFNACRLIDGRSDYSEVEPIGGADIAIQHLSNVKSEVDIRDRLIRVTSQRIDLLHCADGLPRGIERFAAGGSLRLPQQRKNREHAVSHELQDLAAARAKRSGQRLEHFVEQLDDFEPRCAVGELCKSTHI